MPVQNSDVSNIFNKVADLLEIEVENRFRVRDYRNAARTVSGLPRYVSEMVRMEKVMETALERGCVFEVNAHPDRLDLSDRYCKMAKDMGLKVVVSTDAHSTTNLDFMRFGVDQARRGWLEPGDVLNTVSWKELKKFINRK